VYYTTNSGGAHNRVSRFRASAGNPDVAEAGSEQVLLNLPNLGSSNFHNGGALQFGNDGKLYISVGENNQPNRAQDTGDLFGKVLRINADGSVPADNPHGNRVWARGFRNPFTMAVQRSTGRIFVNDVGERAGTDREEVNLLSRGGNFQWPQNRSGAGSFFSYASGCAITGGDFYNPETQNFPDSFTGRYFFGDYCGGWIRHIASSGSPGSAQDFLTGLGRNSIVDVAVHPDGSLYYANRSESSGGVVRRVRFTSGLRITQQPQDRTVTVGQTATFTVAATGGTGTLRYQWRRNGADVPGATSPSFSFPAQAGDNGARFRVVVRDNVTSVTSDEARLTVSLGGQPTCTIFDPRAGATYAAGDTILFSGDCTDPEDGQLPASALEWVVAFHHDDHNHPFAEFPGVRNGSFTIPRSGEVSDNVFFRVHLIGRDSDNQESADLIRDVLPRKAVITLQTSPGGRLVELDGQSRTAPVTFTGVVGVFRDIGTSSPQGSCQFQSWSDGGAIDHQITTPDNNTTFTATFTGCGENTYLWPEAESGTLTAPMQRLTGAGASNNEFIQVAAGNNSQAAPPATGHSVINFSVPSAGSYKVWGRVMVPTNADDSFWVRMDGGPWINWNNIPVGADWHWDDVHNAAAGNALVTFTLGAGSHTLTVAYREDGARLDRVLITNELSFTPSGLGQ
jgi:hypothetical protein